MKNLLISQKLHKALSGKAKKSRDMPDEDWEELDLKARASIRDRSWGNGLQLYDVGGPLGVNALKNPWSHVSKVFLIL